MFVLVLTLLTVGVFEASASQDSYVQWVNYTGEVPDNAVPGGLDVNNNVEYIGRVFYTTNSTSYFDPSTEGYSLGALKPGVESIDIIVYIDPITVTEGIQILVANKSTELEWKASNYDEFPALFDDPAYHPIIGGFQCRGFLYNSTVYLGRVKHNGSDILGNIMTSATTGNNKILFYAAEGEFHKAIDYDVLVYYL